MNDKIPSKVIVYSIAFGLILLATMSLINYINLFNTFAQTYTTNSSVNTPLFLDNQNTTNNKTTKVKDTFTISGPISSLVYVPGKNNTNSKTVNITEQLNSMSKFVLSGNWSISAKQGKIID